MISATSVMGRRSGDVLRKRMTWQTWMVARKLGSPCRVQTRASPRWRLSRRLGRPKRTSLPSPRSHTRTWPVSLAAFGQSPSPRTSGRSPSHARHVRERGERKTGSYRGSSNCTGRSCGLEAEKSNAEPTRAGRASRLSLHDSRWMGLPFTQLCRDTAPLTGSLSVKLLSGSCDIPNELAALTFVVAESVRTWSETSTRRKLTPGLQISWFSTSSGREMREDVLSSGQRTIGAFGP